MVSYLLIKEADRPLVENNDILYLHSNQNLLK